MSDIIEAVQLQDPGSAVIDLFELEYSTGAFAYFYTAVDENLNDIQFRDEAGNINTYTPIPIQAGGFDLTSDGAYTRPELVVANIENVFSTEIGGLSFDDLLGKRLTKRTTLYKYTVGQPEDSTPPIEFPKLVYIIDRIKSKNVIQVVFELAAPFDLAGIVLPRRTIIGGSCPFKYKGAQRTKSPADRIGGCYFETSGVYLNEYDEYIVNLDTISSSAFSTSATKGNYYTTTETATRIASNGVTSSVSITAYWQCIDDTSDSPTDNSSSWRRIRVYTAYSSSDNYYGYKNTKYNDYIIDNGVLWKVAGVSQDANNHNPLKIGKFWTVGDLCGKRLQSCMKHYGAIADGSGGVLPDLLIELPLPFGGFPGAKARR